MSYQHIRDYAPKARKKHNCIVCGELINVGAVHVARVGTDMGDIFTSRMHTDCAEYMDGCDIDSWECHSPGDVTHADVLTELSRRAAHLHLSVK